MNHASGGIVLAARQTRNAQGIAAERKTFADRLQCEVEDEVIAGV